MHMKKKLLLAVLAIGMLSTSSFATIICFTDAFVSSYQINATKTAPKYWTLSGEIGVGAAVPWPVDGYWDAFNQEFYITVSNPSPDGCTFYVDALNIWSTAWAPGTMSWNYEQVCDGAVVFTGTPFDLTYTNGACVGRSMEPDYSNSIFTVGFDEAAAVHYPLQVTETRTLDQILMEEEMSVNRMGDGFVFFSNVFTNSGAELIIYNHVGQQIAVLNGNGSNTIVWDGIATSGQMTDPGMYVAVMRSENEDVTVKFVK